MPFPDRWPIVPWLYPLSDLRAQDGSVFQRFDGGGVVMAWHVRGIPDDPAAMIGVRITDTGQTTLVIAPQGAVLQALGDPNFHERDFDE